MRGTLKVGLPLLCVLFLAPTAGEDVVVPDAPVMNCDDCNLVLISLDTLRADRLGVYGAPTKASPKIDALARQATVFERAYSASCVTADAHMTMFTGLYPSVHGVHNAEPVKRQQVRLAPGITTLPEQLTKSGFRTAAIAAGGNMSGSYGFARGMESYEEIFEISDARNRFSQLLDRYKKGERFMVFFHTYRIHDPYMAKDDFLDDPAYEGSIEHRVEVLREQRQDESFRSLRDSFWNTVDKSSERDRARLMKLYEALVLEVDAVVGSMVQEIKAKHPNTMVVIVSDHGEQFGEHGGFLHNDLYEELVRVPWIVWSPRQATGHRVEAPVSTLDLAPTLLDWLGVAPLEGIQGRSLDDVLHDREAPRPIFAEKRGNGSALRIGSEKIIERYGRRLEFDLVTDPREKSARPLGLEEKLNEMAKHNHSKRSQLEEAQAQDNPAQHDHASALDPGLEAQLQALGYMD